MADNTTLVGLNRLKEFELISGRIGSLIPSYSSDVPAGCLRISSPNTEVLKTDWPELYAKIGGQDGSSSDYFVLPYKPKEGDLEYYLIGKVLFDTTYMNGSIVVSNFTNGDLDAQGCFTFHHGINHTTPIIQIADSSGARVIPSEIINSVSQSKIKITGDYLESITGTWTALAVG